MASFGCDVQATSNELVSVIEDMKERRAKLEQLIRRKEDERNRVLAELKALKTRLVTIDESLKRKLEDKSILDKVINDTSEAFKGIVEASQKLLNNVREESLGLAPRDAP